jgi:hypothetical protein
MANYQRIKGYITDISKGETQASKHFLQISFHTDDKHENDSGYHNIKMWFTPGSLQYDQDKIKRLLEIAKVPPAPAPTTIDAAMAQLCIPQMVALEIPIHVTPNVNPNNGKTQAQYDVGYIPKEQDLSNSGFAGFQDILAERMAAIKAQSQVDEVQIIPDDTVLYSDIDIF